MQTSSCDAKHVVVLAQNDSPCLGSIETCYSGPEIAVLHSESTGGVLDPQSVVILSLMSLFCMHKTTGEGWNPYSLFVLVLSKLFSVHKMKDEVWNP